MMIAAAESGTDNVNREFHTDISQEDEHYNPADPTAVTTEPGVITSY